MLQYDMWLVSPDKHIDCVCKNYDTRQGNRLCPRCLGTGYKIKIKKIKGVRQPGTVSSSGMGVTTETGIYFFKEDYHLKEPKPNVIVPMPRNRFITDVKQNLKKQIIKFF